VDGSGRDMAAGCQVRLSANAIDYRSEQFTPY